MSRIEDTRPAPIALFAHMRPIHLMKTVSALASNRESKHTHLIVFCDAAKKPDHQIAVDEVRKVAASIQGFASVTVVIRKDNLGLSGNIIDGITRVVNEHGRVIVVEDDLIVSPYFLSYMNRALDIYAFDERVISIHGYVYPVSKSLPETFFLLGADCWGWATWRRGWSFFNSDGQFLLDKMKQKKLINKFNFNDTKAFSKMLEDQVSGKNDSWAIRWHASAFLENKLTLYPGRSLVQNIGNDASGTHSIQSDIFNVSLTSTEVKLERITVSHSLIGEVAFMDFFKKESRKLKGKYLNNLTLHTLAFLRNKLNFLK